MKTPVHHTKDFVVHADGTIKPYWSHNSARGWRGSGVFDRNSKEIYEGDIVKILNIFNDYDSKNIQTVTFHDGAFWTGNGLLLNLSVEYIEVVGHSAENRQ